MASRAGRERTLRVQRAGLDEGEAINAPHGVGGETDGVALGLAGRAFLAAMALPCSMPRKGAETPRTPACHPNRKQFPMDLSTLNQYSAVNPHSMPTPEKSEFVRNFAAGGLEVEGGVN